MAKLNPELSGKFEIKFKKLAVVARVLQTTAKFGHFTSLSCRGRQRNVPRIITHVHSHCSAYFILLFSDVAVAVAVVVS